MPFAIRRAARPTCDLSALDEAATKNAAAGRPVIDHAGLARRDAELRLGEADRQGVPCTSNLGSAQRLRGTHPYLHRQHALEFGPKPVLVIKGNRAAAERATGTDHDAAGLRLE